MRALLRPIGVVQRDLCSLLSIDLHPVEASDTCRHRPNFPGSAHALCAACRHARAERSFEASGKPPRGVAGDVGAASAGAPHLTGAAAAPPRAAAPTVAAAAAAMVSSTHEHHDYLRRGREGLAASLKLLPPLSPAAAMCGHLCIVACSNCAPLRCHVCRKKKFATPVKREEVERDWRPRGYSVDLFVDPPGVLAATAAAGAAGRQLSGFVQQPPPAVNS